MIPAVPRMPRALTSLCSCPTSGCSGCGLGPPGSGPTGVPIASVPSGPDTRSWSCSLMMQRLRQVRVVDRQQRPLLQLPGEEPDPGAPEPGHGPQVEQPEEVLALVGVGGLDPPEQVDEAHPQEQQG